MYRNKGNFGFEDGVHGLGFVVERLPLSAGLLTEAEIDAAGRRLKAGIDATAAEMKEALKTRPPFWF